MALEFELFSGLNLQFPTGAMTAALRLWLQLWDTQTGQIVWESTGEATVASELLLPQRIVPLDEIGQKLWLRMIQENVLAEKNARPASGS